MTTYEPLIVMEEGVVRRLGSDAAAITQIDTATLTLNVTTLNVTGNIDTNNNTLYDVGHIDWNTSHTESTIEGRMHWDSDAGTIAIGMAGGTVMLQVGQEQLVRVRNVTGNTINNGTPVYVVDATPAIPRIAVASASSVVTARVLGVTTEDIDHNSNGFINVQGQIHDVDMSAFPEGTSLWLSTTPGEITDTRPDAPNLAVRLGYCLDQKSAGTMLFQLDPFRNLIGLSDVDNTAPTVDGEVLTWNTANSRFQIAGTVNTTDITMTGNIDQVNWMDWSLTPTLTTQEGRMYWEENYGSLTIGLPGGGIEQQIGQAMMIRVRNTTGNTINAGKAVYISGYSGGKPLIDLADADNIFENVGVAITAEDIDHNSNGYVTTAGYVRNIDTSAWAPGTDLYISSNAGELVSLAPDYPANRSHVGKVIAQHATEGILYVAFSVVDSMTGLHGVDPTIPTINGQILEWNTANTLWELKETQNVDAWPQYTNLKTGWDDSAWDNLTLSLNTANYTATLSASADTDYWIEGVKHTFTANTSKQATLNNTEGPKYLILDSSDTLVFSDTAWKIHPDYPATRNEVTVAEGYWSVAQADMITRAIEFHGHHFSTKLHEYLHENFGTRWAEGLGVSTPDNLVLNVAEGELYDEDIEIKIYDGAFTPTTPPWWQMDLTPLDTWTLYRTGASGNWLSTNTATTPVIIAANKPQVNTWNGTAWNLEDVGVNRYFAYWVFASSDRRHPVYLIPGQEDGGTLTEAEENNQLADLDLSNLPTAEHKAIAKIIMQRKAASPYYEIIQIDDYRFDVDSAAGTSSASDHGALSGLSDDDHTQYMTVNASRAFTANVQAPGIGAATGNLELTSTIDLNGNHVFSSDVYFDISESDSFGINTGNNTISGNGSSAIISGRNNTVNGICSAILTGNDNSITGDFGTILGGEGCTASEDYCTVFGKDTLATHWGELAASGGSIDFAGDTQWMRFHLRTTTNSGNAGVLYLDGASKLPTMTTNTIWYVRATVVGALAASNNGAAYRVYAAYKRNGSGAPALLTACAISNPFYGVDFEDHADFNVTISAIGNGIGIGVAQPAGFGDVKWSAMMDVVKVNGAAA